MSVATAGDLPLLATSAELRSHGNYAKNSTFRIIFYEATSCRPRTFTWPMQKTIYSPEHRLFLDLLKHCREAQGVTQTELASRLDWQQALVSRTERGARRIDVLELRRWLGALDIELAEFIAELEEVLQKNTPPGTRKPRKQKAS